MKVALRRRWSGLVLAGALFMASQPEASAQVVVTIDGDTAHATISLTDDNNVTYEADVTIAFDAPLNLSAQSLNLTAELVDPAAIRSRLCPIPLLCPLSVDPGFPVMITVEPVGFPWLFTSGFDGNDDGAGELSFTNTYQFEVHTHDLAYTPDSPYRLYKAPVGGIFADITNDVLEGSMRARGRGAAFSQFLVVHDTRSTSGLSGVTIALAKIADLELRILAAILTDGLRGDLLALLSKVQALLLVNIDAAIATLDQLIGEIDAHAGTDIANVWRADRDLVNDAGDMTALAETLRFNLVRLQGSATH